MRTPIAILAAAAVALAPAATASAKEIASVKICGADGCHDVTARATHAVVDGGPPSTAPRRATPFYRIKVTVRAGEDVVSRWSNRWVPAAGKLQAGDGTWTNPPSTTEDELALLARGIDPLPAARLALPAAAAPPPIASAAAPSPPGDGGLPAAVWAFIAAGSLGLAYALTRAGSAFAARRRGAAPAG